MTIVGGLLLILTGLGIMFFGLLLFYAWLPLIYALIGLDVGLMLGRSLTGDVGTLSIVLGIAGAVILGAASYLLEPYRRMLLGISGGILVGFSLAAALGIDGWMGGLLERLMALAFGVIGGVLVPRYFDMLVIGASAISGATMAVAGAYHILPRAAIFDHAGGGILPVLITIALAVTGIGWQYANLARWARPSQVTSGAKRLP